MQIYIVLSALAMATGLGASASVLPKGASTGAGLKPSEDPDRQRGHEASTNKTFKAILEDQRKADINKMQDPPGGCHEAKQNAGIIVDIVTTLAAYTLEFEALKNAIFTFVVVALLISYTQLRGQFESLQTSKDNAEKQLVLLEDSNAKLSSEVQSLCSALESTTKQQAEVMRGMEAEKKKWLPLLSLPRVTQKRWGNKCLSNKSSMHTHKAWFSPCRAK